MRMKTRTTAATAVIAALICMICIVGCGSGHKGEDGPDPVPAPTPSASTRFDFQTTTIDGQRVGFADYSDANVILVNLWEPWCGPCVGEMPDLERLYEAHKDQGFLIIGAYSTVQQKDDALAIMAQCGTTYPVIVVTSDFDAYQTGYVPTSFLVDGDGNVLSEPIVGSHSYKEWESIIEPYL